MSDYAVDVKVRNARIKRAMRAAGYKNVNQFCLANGFTPSVIGQLLNLKRSPLTKRGRWRSVVLRMCETLKTTPDDLFSETQRTMQLKTSTASFEVTEEKMRQIAGATFEEIRLLTAENVQPDLPVETHQLKTALVESVSELPENQQRILNLRYGLDGEEPRSYCEIAKMMNLSRERVRQIEKQALVKLRRGKAQARLRPAMTGEDPEVDLLELMNRYQLKQWNKTQRALEQYSEDARECLRALQLPAVFGQGPYPNQTWLQALEEAERKREFALAKLREIEQSALHPEREQQESV